MSSLAIECSSQSGSVALLECGVVVGSWEFVSPRGRGAELFSRLEYALRAARDLDLVVVGTGPGRYNGLRTAIAAGWGIARARGSRLAGVSSLLGYREADYFVAGDARAGQWFMARVSSGKFLIPPALYAPHDARRLLEPGVPVFAPAPLDGLPEAVFAAPSAAVLAARDFAEGHPAPDYLKPPHITKPAARPTNPGRNGGETVDS